MDKRLIMKKLFLDIETIRGPIPPSIDDIEAPANYKDPEKIAAYKAAALDKEWAKQALQSHKGRIVCAAFAIDNGEVECITGDEKYILENINEATEQLTTPVGHNVAFDLLFIAHRGLAHGISFDSFRPTSKWDKPYIDTMELASFGLQWRYMISLSDLCDLCDIERPYGKGEDVQAQWDAGKLDEIKKHCISDVKAVRECYYKLTEH
jgi:3'-5' exonuclease